MNGPNLLGQSVDARRLFLRSKLLLSNERRELRTEEIIPDVKHICRWIFPHLTQRRLEFLTEYEQLVPVLLSGAKVEIIVLVLVVWVVEVDVDLLDASGEFLAQAGSCEFTGTLHRAALNCELMQEMDTNLIRLVLKGTLA